MRNLTLRVSGYAPNGDTYFKNDFLGITLVKRPDGNHHFTFKNPNTNQNQQITLSQDDANAMLRAYQEIVNQLRLRLTLRATGGANGESYYKDDSSGISLVVLPGGGYKFSQKIGGNHTTVDAPAHVKDAMIAAYLNNQIDNQIATAVNTVRTPPQTQPAYNQTPLPSLFQQPDPYYTQIRVGVISSIVEKLNAVNNNFSNILTLTKQEVEFLKNPGDVRALQDLKIKIDNYLGKGAFEAIVQKADTLKNGDGVVIVDKAAQSVIAQEPNTPQYRR